MSGPLVMQGLGSEFELAGVLQLLEAQGTCGRVTCGRHWLELYAGVVVAASGEAAEVVAELVEAKGVFEVRKTRGAPAGQLRASVTALLLEAARVRDETCLKG